MTRGEVGRRVSDGQPTFCLRLAMVWISSLHHRVADVSCVDFVIWRLTSVFAPNSRSIPSNNIAVQDLSIRR